MRTRQTSLIKGVAVVALLTTILTVTPVLAAVPWDDDDALGDDPDDEISVYCENPDAAHPVGSRLAAAYEVDYETIMEWYCVDEHGFGNIMLALATAPASDATPEEFLARRLDGEGWGLIWQSAGLIGRDRVRDTEPGEGGGRPEDRGPRDNRGRPEDPGNFNSNGVGPNGDRGLHLGHDKDKDRGRP